MDLIVVLPGFIGLGNCHLSFRPKLLLFFGYVAITVV